MKKRIKIVKIMQIKNRNIIIKKIKNISKTMNMTVKRIKNVK